MDHVLSLRRVDLCSGRRGDRASLHWTGQAFDTGAGGHPFYFDLLVCIAMDGTKPDGGRDGICLSLQEMGVRANWWNDRGYGWRLQRDYRSAGFGSSMKDSVRRLYIFFL